MSENLALAPAGFASASFADVQALAAAIAKSGLFAIKTPEQALTLMAISQAEGRPMALAARDYDIIHNRPSKKAEAMQRDFLTAGGKIEWHKLDDSIADATFSHPQGGSLRIVWDLARAKAAGLGARAKDNPNAPSMWEKYPRQMLRSRCVSEGVRTIYPMATSGMYAPEEVDDTAQPARINVTTQPIAAAAMVVDVQQPAVEQPAEPAPVVAITKQEIGDAMREFMETYKISDMQTMVARFIRPAGVAKTGDATLAQLAQMARLLASAYEADSKAIPPVLASIFARHS